MDVLDILWARSLRRPLSFAGPTQPYNFIHTQNSFDHKVNGVSGAEASDYLSDLPDVMVLFVRPPRRAGVICPPSTVHFSILFQHWHAFVHGYFDRNEKYLYFEAKWWSVFFCPCCLWQNVSVSFFLETKGERGFLTLHGNMEYPLPVTWNIHCQ